MEKKLNDIPINFAQLFVGLINKAEPHPKKKSKDKKKKSKRKKIKRKFGCISTRPVVEARRKANALSRLLERNWRQQYFDRYQKSQSQIRMPDRGIFTASHLSEFLSETFGDIIGEGTDFFDAIVIAIIEKLKIELLEGQILYFKTLFSMYMSEYSVNTIGGLRVAGQGPLRRRTIGETRESRRSVASDIRKRKKLDANNSKPIGPASIPEVGFATGGEENQAGDNRGETVFSVNIGAIPDGVPCCEPDPLRSFASTCDSEVVQDHS